MSAVFDCSLRSLRIQLLATDFVVARRRKSVVDSLLLSSAALDPKNQSSREELNR